MRLLQLEQSYYYFNLESHPGDRTQQFLMYSLDDPIGGANVELMCFIFE
jgi:hypothetical protein